MFFRRKPSGFEMTDRATGSVQCARPLSADQARDLDAHLARHPRAWLRVYRELGDDVSFDLDFLAGLPALRHLHLDADAGRLNDFAALSAVPAGLESLSIDTVARFSDKALDKPKRNTHELGRFRALRSLQLCGKLSDVSFLPQLPGLASLSLWRNGLRSLEGVDALQALRTFDIHFNPSAPLHPLAACAALDALEVWDARGLDGDAFAHPGVRRAWFLSCGKGFTIRAGADWSALRVAVIHSADGPANLRRLASAPRLACLVLSNTPAKLAFEDFAPLFGHPTLREVRADEVKDGVLERLAAEQGWRCDPAPNFPADAYLD